jgi:predicted ATPase
MHGATLQRLRKFLEAHGTRIATPDDRNFETEGEAIESGLRRTMQGRDMVMRSLIQAVYRFRDAIACLCIQAETKWHFGEIASCRGTLSEAKSLAKKLNDMHGLVQALSVGGFIAYCEREASEVQRLASEMLDLSTRQNFAFFRSGAAILRDWAQSALGDTTQGVLAIEHGVKAWRENGVVIDLSLWLALKAEALHLAGLTFKALETLREAEAVIQRSEERYWSTELHRLRGVFLAAIGSDQNQIEASFRAAIRTAQEQKSFSLVRRAKESYAEWRAGKEQPRML